MQRTRPPVFDERERTLAAPAANEESSFEFLNRVAGAYWEHPRQLIELWASHLPDDAGYADIRARLRSRNNSQFNSAFLELYLHETLLRTGHTVTIHPKLRHTARRPDFYASKNGAGFYLEAIVPGLSKEFEVAAARRSRFIDVVNRLEDPNFILRLHRLDIGPGEPAAARLRSELKRWLATIDPDTVTEYADAPRFRWEREGWIAEFSAVPLRPEARGHDRDDRRAIAIYTDQEAGWVNDADLIRKALGSKHREYGTITEPFLIAVGLFIFDTDRWHAMNAFFGHERVIVDSGRAFRGGDGYFGAPTRWQNTSVSGVLLVNQLQPYHVHKADVSLWIHPGAEHPLPDAGWPCDTMTLVNEHVTTTPSSASAADLFELEEPWPPGAPWPSKT